MLTKETNFDLIGKYKVTHFPFLTQPDNSISFFLKVKKEPGYRQIRIMLWLSGKIYLSNNSILFFLLRKEPCVLSYFSHVQLFATLCNSNLLSSSVCRFLRARILEWVAMPSQCDIPNPGIKLVFLISPALASSFFFFFNH